MSDEEITLTPEIARAVFGGAREAQATEPEGEEPQATEPPITPQLETEEPDPELAHNATVISILGADAKRRRDEALIRTLHPRRDDPPKAA